MLRYKFAMGTQVIAKSGKSLYRCFIAQP